MIENKVNVYRNYEQLNLRNAIFVIFTEHIFKTNYIFIQISTYSINTKKITITSNCGK